MFGKWIDRAISGAMAEEDEENRRTRSAPSLRVAGRLVHETDAAFLFSVNGEDIWFPKSHAQLADDGDGGDVLLITQWIAEQKGLI